MILQFNSCFEFMIILHLAFLDLHQKHHAENLYFIHKYHSYFLMFQLQKFRQSFIFHLNYCYFINQLIVTFLSLFYENSFLIIFYFYMKELEFSTRFFRSFIKKKFLIAFYFGFYVYDQGFQIYDFLRFWIIWIEVQLLVIFF